MRATRTHPGGSDWKAVLAPRNLDPTTALAFVDSDVTAFRRRRVYQQVSGGPPNKREPKNPPPDSPERPPGTNPDGPPSPRRYDSPEPVTPDTPVPENPM